MEQGTKLEKELTTIINKEELFDDSPDRYKECELKLKPDLSDAVAEFALTKLIHFAFGGICIVSGAPGAGKDLFGNFISYMLKYCFDTKVFRDEKPRYPFGYYQPFNPQTAADELAEFAEMTTMDLEGLTAKDKKAIQKMSNLVDSWLEKAGRKKFSNSVLYLTEFWRYMPRRDPHKPIGYLLTGLMKQWRHMNLLLLGTSQFITDLDVNRCMKLVTHQLLCRATEYGTNQYAFVPVRMVDSTGALETTGKRTILEIDWRDPLPGQPGLNIGGLYNSKSR